MVADAVLQSLTRQLAQFTRELQRARQGVPRGVHQSRVASRRLRESLRALDVVLPKDLRRRALRTLRVIARALGGVRECDVTLDLLAEDSRRHVWPEAAVALVQASLEADRARRHGQLLAVIEEQRWRRHLSRVRDVVRDLATPDVRRHVGTTARLRRRQRGQSLRNRLATLSALYVPDHLHELRIALKKARYALEWEEQLGQRRWQRDRAVLEATQDELGAWHDRLVLQERINRVRRTGDHPREVSRDLKQMAAQLERECRARHATIRSMVPALTRIASRAAR